MTNDDPRVAITLTIVRPKLTRSLLDLTSRDGAGKAKFFLGAGFTVDSLEQALLHQGVSGSLKGVRETEWGLVISVTGPMPLPKGGTTNILSAWQIDFGSPGVGRLLTAHLD